MGQKENLELMIKLHNAMTGNSKPLDKITGNLTIDPDISLSHFTQAGGKVPAGGKVKLEDYYTLGDEVDSKNAAGA